MEAEDLVAKLIEWLEDEGWTGYEIILFVTQKIATRAALKEAS